MKIIFLTALVYLFFSSSNTLIAQAPAIEWQKCYGGTYGESAQSVEQTSDGGYIVAGYSDSRDKDVTLNNGMNDFWVMKLNSLGIIQWQKSYGGSGDDEARCIHQNSDGGFIIAGASGSKNTGDVTSSHSGMEYWIVKTGSAGNILWQKSYGGSGDDYAYSIQATPDAGYIVAGYSESNDGDVSGNHGMKDFWIVKLNSIGVILWQKSYGGSKNDEAYSVQNTKDGGFIVAGKTESNDGDVSGNHGGSDYWIIKLNSNGTLQWQKALGGSKEEIAHALQQSADGGYIIAGSADSNDFDVSGLHSNAPDYWIVKLNATGNLQWQECLGGTFTEIAFDIQSTPDGGNVICGYSNSMDSQVSCNLGLEDFWVIKLDPVGKIEWQRTMGGNYYDEAYSIKPTNDGGYIVVGLTYSTTIPGYHPSLGRDAGDFWIVKLTPAPEAAPLPTISISPDSPSICGGSLLSFSVATANEGPGPSIIWKKNGVSVATGPGYSANNFAVNDTIVCILTTSATCLVPAVSSSDTVVIMNNTYYQPTISISTASTSVCNGALVEFNATTTTSGGSPATYQWAINGNVVGNSAPQFTSSVLKNGDIVSCSYALNPVPTCYTLGTAVSNNLVMNVSGTSAPIVGIALSNNNVCPGSAITATANSQNAGSPPSFEWFLNENGVANSNEFSSTDFKNGDKIFCVLTPGSGACSGAQVFSDTVTLSILDAPAIEIHPADTAILHGNQVQLNANISGNVASYQWSPANLLTNTSSLAPLTLDLNDNATFTFSAVGFNGCVATAAASIKVLKSIYLPNAFTPNGDGLNDVFRIPPGVAFTLGEFDIYDRWGVKIFSSRDIMKGWDGKIQGKPAAPGVYVYTVKGNSDKGNVSLRGTVTLIR